MHTDRTGQQPTPTRRWWVDTVSGARLDLALPRHRDISSLDIAHALALTNRFQGHTSRPYSGAEHALLVLEVMQRDHACTSPWAHLCALLADACDVYLGRLERQVIGRMGSTCGLARELDEERLRRHILTRFGVAGDWVRWRDTIADCDAVATATARRDLQPGPPLQLAHDAQPCDWIGLADRGGLSWQDWRQAWLDAFAAANFAIKHAEPA